MADTFRGSTVFVGNLPYSTTKSQLENLFSDTGPLKRCFVVADKGFGYVTFAIREDALLAVDQVKSLGGRKLNLKFAKPKSGKIPKISEDETNSKVDPPQTLPTKQKKTIRKKSIIKKGRLIIRNLSFKANENHIKQEFEKYGKVVEIVIPKKEDGKMLGFCFVQYGKVTEAASALKAMNAQSILDRPIAVDWSIPKREYVELTKTHSEANGSDETTNEEDKKCGSDIVSDSSTSSRNLISKYKNVSESKNLHKKNKDYTDTNTKSSTTLVHDIQYQDSDEHLLLSKGFNDDDTSSSEEEKDDHCSSISVNREDGSSIDKEASESCEDSKPDMEIRKVQKYKTKNERNKHCQSDVVEGKTLFIRNINFITSEEQLHEAFSKFGLLHYAMICIDQLTEHSKGTGFVKFKNKEDADKCLAEVEITALIIDGQELKVTRAISREELQKRAEDKIKPRKDKRNLYLAREGLIRPGTCAAEGVSKQDMMRRAEPQMATIMSLHGTTCPKRVDIYPKLLPENALEIRKRQMLRNLHIFVSKTRLCVRNIPLSLKESQLKKIFLKAAGPGATVNEIRIMKNMMKAVPGSLGESKGYGFIGFTKHEHALQALRNTNNNPSTFTTSMRPIVEFSLENRAILKVKERRLEMSRQKNKAGRDVEDKKFAHQRLTNIKKSVHDNIKDSSNTHESFVGTKANMLSNSKALPSHLGPKIRHNRKNTTKLSRRSLQKQKLKYRERKKQLKSLAMKSNKLHTIVSKKKPVSNSDAKLDNLVNNYKRKLELNDQKIEKKNKWFHSN